MKILVAFVLLFTVTHCGNFDKPHCGKGEVWTDGCVPPCPETCPPYVERPCIEICRLGGCVCKAGYVRDQYENNTCVQKDKCTKPPVSTTATPIKCGENEQFSDCATPAICQRQCPNVPPSGIMCIKMCQKGCLCKPGYVRDPRKRYKCIKETQC